MIKGSRMSKTDTDLPLSVHVNSCSPNYDILDHHRHVDSILYIPPLSAPDAHYADDSLPPTYAQATAINRTAVDGSKNLPQIDASVRAVQSSSTNNNSDGFGTSSEQTSNRDRQLIIRTSSDGKFGMKVGAADQGIFISSVAVGSPAALAGLCVGDQILQMGAENVAGWSSGKATKKLKQAAISNCIELSVRDRPSVRKITLHRSISTKNFGFTTKDGGKIVSIDNDSSAALNGMLVEHQLLEINGVDITGMRQREIDNMVDTAGAVVTITTMPWSVYWQIKKGPERGLLAVMACFFVSFSCIICL